MPPGQASAALRLPTASAGELTPSPRPAGVKPRKPAATLSGHRGAGRVMAREISPGRGAASELSLAEVAELLGTSWSGSRVVSSLNVGSPCPISVGTFVSPKRMYGRSCWRAGGAGSPAWRGGGWWPDAGGRRRFGYVRKLPSGRFQASFIAPSGTRQTAPRTFLRRTDADRWLLRLSPTSPVVHGWMRSSVESCSATTRGVSAGPPGDWSALAGDLCVQHSSAPATLLDRPLQGHPDGCPGVVRGGDAGEGGRTSITQSYRFFRAVLYSAVRDGAVARNPCQVPGAGAERAGSGRRRRPLKSWRWWRRSPLGTGRRCFSPRGAGCAEARSGPVRDDIDLRQERSGYATTTLSCWSRRAFDTDPKSAAGKRTVFIPPHVMPYLTEHTAKWAGEERFFVGREALPMRGKRRASGVRAGPAQTGCPASRSMTCGNGSDPRGGDWGDATRT